MTSPNNAGQRAWFRAYEPRPGASASLICLPHAGGGASAYRPWAARVPEWVELLAVQYPGHEDRLAEARIDDMGALVEAFVEALPEVLHRPYVLFGHSMGGAIAHEAAIELEKRAWPLPRWLVVSGRPAPPYHRDRGHHRLDDEEFVEQLRELGGTVDEALDHPEIRRLLLPIVRDDYRLVELYRPTGTRLARTSLLACAGEEDPNVSRPELEQWSEETGAGFELRVYPGGHFYLQARHETLDDILRVTLDGTS